MPQSPIEVHTEEGDYLVSQLQDQLRCQVKVPDGPPRDIAYWNELPVSVRPAIQSAVDRLSRPRVSSRSERHNFRWD